MARPNRNTSSPSAQRLQAILNNTIPLAGGWLRRQSVDALTRLSQAGDPLATRILARAFDNHTDPVVKDRIQQHFKAALPSPSMDAAWEVWVENRGKLLSNALAECGRPATTPISNHILSTLFLQQETALFDAPAEMIEPVVNACDDRDSLIASRARYTLAKLKNQQAISGLCVLWSRTRQPLLESTLAQAGYQPDQPPQARVLVALKFNRLELITNGEPDGIASLVLASSDPDPEIKTRARFCLLNLQNQASVNAICVLWLETRDPRLGDAIQQMRYIASRPPKARLFSSLKADRVEIAGNISPENLPLLMNAVADEDAVVAENALKALHSLRRIETQVALCQAAVIRDDATARNICLETGYLPVVPEQRALFLFLTEQWQPYEILDFDQRLLNAVYETSTLEIRQRILRKVQQAGRSDYLKIVTGVDDRSRAAQINTIEARLLVQILTDNKDWDRLWHFALELSLQESVDIIRLLRKNDWLPTDSSDCELFITLAELATHEMLLSGPELIQALPPAVPRITLKITGRVNSVAFSPVSSHLAIGTGAGRLAIWNYQEARIEKVYKDFNHSIGRVTYTPSGALCCAERANTSTSCQIYHCENGHARAFGGHNASVTSLLPVNDTLILSTGRDLRVKLWNFSTQSLEGEQQLADWARSACIASDGNKAGLFHKKLEVIALPSFERLPDLPTNNYTGARIEKSISRCLSFLPNGTDLLVGQHNGQVILHGEHTQSRARVITRHAKAVEGIRCLPHLPVLVTAGAEGRLHFFHLPDYSLIGSTETGGGDLVSLQISPDGAFMATGTNRAGLILWDLRVLDVPALFIQPLAKAVPNQVAAVNALAGYNRYLPQPVIDALHYLQCLLQHRFRYDIHVSDLPGLQAGEFDIILE